MKKTLLSVLVTGAFMLVAAAAISAAPVQWPSSAGGNNHWYEVVKTPDRITFGAARAAAEARGGYLAIPSLPGEALFIYNNLTLPAAGGQMQYYWLGAYANGSVDGYRWYWVTGEPVTQWGGYTYIDWSYGPSYHDYDGPQGMAQVPNCQWTAGYALQDMPDSPDYPQYWGHGYVIEFDFYPSAQPTANAGSDQTVKRNTLVTLAGIGTDPEGDYPLSYAWSLIRKPDGSAALLSGADTATPSFTPDLPGDYEVTLVVRNAAGVASAPDSVVLSTVNSAPTADAGLDQPLLREGETIRLDGSRSWDDDGDPLAYAWSFTARPEGSAATLSGAATATATFVADRRGIYTALLTVRDPFGGTSSDSVTVSFENVRPVADAGNNDVVALGGTAVLDGGGSSDANGDPLTYAWSLAEKPAGSAAALDDLAALAPRFRADRYGDYRLTLVVSDGTVASEPSAVTISCLRQDGDAQRFLVTAIDMVNLMDEGEFKNGNMRNTLTQKLAVVLKQIEQGQTAEATQKLREDVLAKADGCAAAGAADKNDWVTGCAAQRDLYPLLQTVLDILQP